MVTEPAARPTTVAASVTVASARLTTPSTSFTGTDACDSRAAPQALRRSPCARRSAATPTGVRRTEAKSGRHSTKRPGDDEPPAHWRPPAAPPRPGRRRHLGTSKHHRQGGQVAMVRVTPTLCHEDDPRRPLLAVLEPSTVCLSAPLSSRPPVTAVMPASAPRTPTSRRADRRQRCPARKPQSTGAGGAPKCSPHLRQRPWNETLGHLAAPAGGNNEQSQGDDDISGPAPSAQPSGHPAAAVIPRHPEWVPLSARARSLRACTRRPPSMTGGPWLGTSLAGSSTYRSHRRTRMLNRLFEEFSSLDRLGPSSIVCFLPLPCPHGRSASDLLAKPSVP